MILITSLRDGLLPLRPRRRRFTSTLTVTAPLALGLAALLVVGCGRSAPPQQQAALPAIPVAKPVQDEVTDYVDFTGQTDSPQSVNIVPRVTGYIDREPFREGAEVNKGDVLFEIDPRPYQAQFNQAQAQVHFYEAQLELAIANYSRAVDLLKSGGGIKTISQQDVDMYRAQQHQAEAALEAFKASLEVFKLDLEFCTITSPLDGKISRYYLTVGNLVNQDQSLLTTIVSLDPMYAYFQVDEPTLLRIRKALVDGSIARPATGTAPVQMALQGEEGYPHEGTINFVNNQVSPTTGTIAFRGVFPNPKLANDVRLLSPGMFVRVRLPIGQPHPALLVIDRAILTDQGLKYVYVVDSEKKVQYRRVTPGPLQENGLRVIEGVKPDEWVVVGGLQQVRPRMEIRPDAMAMPTIGAPSASPGAPAATEKEKSGDKEKPAEKEKPASEPNKPQDTKPEAAPAAEPKH
jgi:membrane fusion protein, multidrug efflux system